MSEEIQVIPPVLVATRLSPEFAEQLAEIASKEKRSISAQVALILEEYLTKQAA